MLSSKANKILLLISCFILAVIPANANAGVPMLFVVYPGFIITLIPVIFIETFYIRYKLGGGSFKKVFNVTLLANLVSTFAGIPLTWLAAFLVEIMLSGAAPRWLETIWAKLYAGIVQAPWLMPYEEDLFWLIPIAFTVLMIYFFLASWLIEYWIIYLFFKKDYNKILIRKSVFRANLISYIFLYFAGAVYYSGWLLSK